MSHQFDARLSVLYKNRYFDQNEFDIIINHKSNESKDSTNSFIQLENLNVKCNVVFIPVSVKCCYAQTAVIGSDIFVFGRSYNKVKKTSSVDVSSRSSWENFTPMHDPIKYFSVCTFMKCIYITSGNFKDDSYSKKCFKYEINSNKWT